MLSLCGFTWCVLSCSVASNFLRPDGLQPARLLCPWDSPGKNTGVGCHALLQGVFPTQVSCIAGRFLPSEPPGKPRNTGLGSLSLLQGIFLTQELNQGFLHCRQILYQLSYQGSLNLLGTSINSSGVEQLFICISEVTQSCQLFATPWIVAYQAPLSMGFSRQEYWSGLPFPSSGDLPDPGIEPWSPALQADALTSEPPGKHSCHSYLFDDESVKPFAHFKN